MRRWRGTVGWEVRIAKPAPTKDFSHPWSPVLGIITAAPKLPSLETLLYRFKCFLLTQMSRRELEEGTDLEQLASSRNTCEFCGKVSTFLFEERHSTTICIGIPVLVIGIGKKYVPSCNHFPLIMLDCLI